MSSGVTSLFAPVVGNLQVGGGANITVNGGMTADNLTLDASTLSVSGELNVSGLLWLKNSSVLTHPAATATTSSKLEIHAGNTTIDATSMINVSAKGYLGGYSNLNSPDGNSSPSGRTIGNLSGSGSTAGGSYGGVGGAVSPAIANTVYGSLTNPDELGSGGGSHVNSATLSGGNGGGLVRISTGVLQLAGKIVADGGAGGINTYYGTGGSGGSGGGIRIYATSLDGAGYIYARGGMNGSYRGGGGGGRIAIHYGDMTLPQVNVVASGGSGSVNGGAGTVYFRSNLDGSDSLVVDNRGTDTGESSTPLPALGTWKVGAVSPTSITTSGANWQPGAWKGRRFNPNTSQTKLFTVLDNDATTIYTDGTEGDLAQVTAVNDTCAGAYSFSSMTVTGKGRVSSLDQLAISGELVIDGSTLVTNSITADKVAVRNGGVLSHYPATVNTAYSLLIGAGTSFTLEAGSRIDVSGRGYLGAYSGDNNSAYGRTYLGLAETNMYAGGSYGGLGGVSSGAPVDTYGDQSNPNELGSGGSSEIANCKAGNGGGLVRIIADTVALDGNILADGGGGGSCSMYYTGGNAGSGGGVRIDAATLSGNGFIYARGGTTKAMCGGGGGRIALYSNNLLLPQSNLLVGGGTGFKNGSTGTLYLH